MINVTPPLLTIDEKRQRADDTKVESSNHAGMLTNDFPHRVNPTQSRRHLRPDPSSYHKDYLAACARRQVQPHAHLTKFFEQHHQVDDSIHEMWEFNDIYLGRRGCLPIVDLARRNTVLRRLSLAGTGLRNDGVEELVRILRFHPTLEILNVSDNNISDTAGRAFLLLFHTNPILRRVWTKNTHINAKFQAVLENPPREAAGSSSAELEGFKIKYLPNGYSRPPPKAPTPIAVASNDDEEEQPAPAPVKHTMMEPPRTEGSGVKLDEFMASANGSSIAKEDTSMVGEAWSRPITSETDVLTSLDLSDQAADSSSPPLPATSTSSAPESGKNKISLAGLGKMVWQFGPAQSMRQAIQRSTRRTTLFNKKGLWSAIRKGGVFESQLGADAECAVSSSSPAADPDGSDDSNAAGGSNRTSTNGRLSNSSGDDGSIDDGAHSNANKLSMSIFAAGPPPSSPSDTDDDSFGDDAYHPDFRDQTNFNSSDPSNLSAGAGRGAIDDIELEQAIGNDLDGIQEKMILQALRNASVTGVDKQGKRSTEKSSLMGTLQEESTSASRLADALKEYSRGKPVRRKKSSMMKGSKRSSILGMIGTRGEPVKKKDTIDSFGNSAMIPGILDLQSDVLSLLTSFPPPYYESAASFGDENGSGSARNGSPAKSDRSSPDKSSRMSSETDDSDPEMWLDHGIVCAFVKRLCECGYSKKACELAEAALGHFEKEALPKGDLLYWRIRALVASRNITDATILVRTQLRSATCELQKPRYLEQAALIQKSLFLQNLSKGYDSVRFLSEDAATLFLTSWSLGGSFRAAANAALMLVVCREAASAKKVAQDVIRKALHLVNSKESGSSISIFSSDRRQSLARGSVMMDTGRRGLPVIRGSISAAGDQARGGIMQGLPSIRGSISVSGSLENIVAGRGSTTQGPRGSIMRENRGRPSIAKGGAGAARGSVVGRMRESISNSESGINHTDLFEAKLTLAEAYVITGNDKEAAKWYKKALKAAVGNLGLISEMQDNMNLCDEFMDRDISDSVLGLLSTAEVVVFWGQPVDPPTSLMYIFPDDEELQQEITRELSEMLDDSPLLVGYSGISSGADVLFLEYLVSRRAEVHVVLPFVWEDFALACIDYGDPLFSGWRTRCESLLKAACVQVHYATTERYLDDPVLFSHSWQVMKGLAILRGDQLGGIKPRAVCLLDESLPDDHDLKRWYQQWTLAGLPAKIIQLEALRASSKINVRDYDLGGPKAAAAHLVASQRVTTPYLDSADRTNIISSDPFQADILSSLNYFEVRHRDERFEKTLKITEQEMSSRVTRGLRSFIFIDIVTTRYLSDKDVPVFFRLIFKVFQDVIKESGIEPEAIEQWGVGFYFVFKNVVSCAAFAVYLQRAMDAIHWASYKLPSSTAWRIGVHSGPAFPAGNNKIFHHNLYFGRQSGHARELVGAGEVAQVIVSEQFAAALIQADRRFIVEYLGKRKSDGLGQEVALYRLKFSDDFDLSKLASARGQFAAPAPNSTGRQLHKLNPLTGNAEKRDETSSTSPTKDLVLPPADLSLLDAARTALIAKLADQFVIIRESSTWSDRFVVALVEKLLDHGQTGRACQVLERALTEGSSYADNSRLMYYRIVCLQRSDKGIEYLKSLLMSHDIPTNLKADVAVLYAEYMRRRSLFHEGDLKKRHLEESSKYFFEAFQMSKKIRFAVDAAVMLKIAGQHDRALDVCNLAIQLAKAEVKYAQTVETMTNAEVAKKLSELAKDGSDNKALQKAERAAKEQQINLAVRHQDLKMWMMATVAMANLMSGRPEFAVQWYANALDVGEVVKGAAFARNVRAIYHQVLPLKRFIHIPHVIPKRFKTCTGSVVMFMSHMFPIKTHNTVKMEAVLKRELKSHIHSLKYACALSSLGYISQLIRQ